MAEELNPFKISQEQLDSAAEIMDLDKEAHAILREPMRTLTVNIPARMRDGTTKTIHRIQGAVQRRQGALQGRDKVPPRGEHRHREGAERLDDMEDARLANIPYGGAKGGIICDPKA